MEAIFKLKQHIGAALWFSSVFWVDCFFRMASSNKWLLSSLCTLLPVNSSYENLYQLRKVLIETLHYPTLLYSLRQNLKPSMYAPSPSYKTHCTTILLTARMNINISNLPKKISYQAIVSEKSTCDRQEDS